MRPRREPALAVVIPCHDSAHLLPDCLAALAAQTLSADRFEVVVVETEGRAGAAAAVQRTGGDSGLSVRHLYGPDGPAAKRNLGAAKSDAPYLAFTDPDCLPDPQWLEAGLKRLEGGAKLVQGRVEPPSGETSSALGHAIWVTRESGLYEASNVFYERGAFESAGGFPEHWFERIGVPFGEDAELGWAVRRSSGATCFEPGALVRHRVFPADAEQHLRDQLRAEHFPALVRAIPELREELLVDRLFLGTGNRAFWLAIAGLMAARHFRPAALFAVPYLISLGRRSEGSGDPARRAAIAVALTASDAARVAALLKGSLRARSPVL